MNLTDERLDSLNANALWLLRWLLLNADENMEVRLSGRDLSDLTGMSYKTVRCAIDSIVKNGLGAQARAQARAQAASLKLLVNTDSSEGTKVARGASKGASKGAQKKKCPPYPLKEKIKEEKKETLKRKETNEETFFGRKLENQPECPPPTPSQKRFIPPSVEEVAEYCKSRGNDIDAEEFVAFYNQRGWVQGRSRLPIKSWKDCVITWEKARKKKESSGASFGIIKEDTQKSNYTQAW